MGTKKLPEKTGSSKKRKFYITAAIPYVNAAPHIGHALEFVQTDTIARYQKLLGKNVLVLSGGDENAIKNVESAEKAGVPIQKFIDQNTKIFYKLTKALNCQFDIWQKGSDKKKHHPSVQKLWNLCYKSGDIYKKKYKGLYCIGCAAFYTPDELNEKGECPEHPGVKLLEVSEENYFFSLSKYQDQLIHLIESGKIKIIPETRKNEVLSFLRSGLEDISISRSNERARNWGVPVPNDHSQRIYVWFDALNIYQSGIGFGWNEKNYKKWWPADIHVIGKGISRFHTVYWPAFLLSAGLKLPKSIFIHGYFTVNGQKMSKTIGNVIDPFYLIKKYGPESLRYYLLAKFNPFTDGDFSEEKLIQAYSGDLANGLGNLISRVAKLCEKAEIKGVKKYTSLDKRVVSKLNKFRFDLALEEIWSNKISSMDKSLSNKKPWEIKDKKVLKREMTKYADRIMELAYNLKPFLPKTAEEIEAQFSSPKIKSKKPLFPRL